MSLVTLVSGGLDSTVMALLAKEEAIEQHPLFVDYGQLSRNREWRACLGVHRRLGLPRPQLMDLSGIGRVIACGLTRRRSRINEDAFLPGRNLFFLLAGVAYACHVRANGVAIGLLSEQHRIFPDQTGDFLAAAERILSVATLGKVRLIAPLMDFTKAEVLRLARARGIRGTYSCHGGHRRPCGKCVSCLEIASAEGQGG